MVASFIARVSVQEPAAGNTSADRSDGRSDAAEVVERLVRDHARFVFRVAYAVVRNHHDAEDVAQETFLRVMRQAHRLAEIEDARAWLGTVAFRVATERRRQPLPFDLDPAADDLSGLADRATTVDEEVLRSQLAELMWRTVETLPPELRDALKLSTVGELTSAQAALLLGVPEGTVRNRVHRAKHMLQQKVMARLGRPSTQT